MEALITLLNICIRRFIYTALFTSAAVVLLMIVNDVTNHRNGVRGDMINWNFGCAMSSFGLRSPEKT